MKNKALYLLMKSDDAYQLFVKAVTWHKDSHGLFDYEINKAVTYSNVELPLLHHFVFLYRKAATSEIRYVTANSLEKHTPAEGQLIGAFEIVPSEASNLVGSEKQPYLKFFTTKEIQQAEREAGEQPNRKEDLLEQIYLIVRSLKTKDNDNKGYRLQAGHIVKMGRVEFKVTSANGVRLEQEKCKLPFWNNFKTLYVTPEPKEGECKYCMLGEGDQQNPNCEKGEFLCSPCKCSGSCELVHFKCLQIWNQSKIKKEVTGGTINYNLQKFFCEVCCEEYPRYISKNDRIHELMPIKIPNTEHVMLESLGEKSNNVIMVQNVPTDGIRLGRGQQSEIRLTDISVSRTHAHIVKQADGYYVYDNKSKFGTLVLEQNLEMQLSKLKQGVQIGRSVITFEKKKRNEK